MKKYHFLLILFCFFLNIYSNCQEESATDSNFIVFQSYLPEYKIDTCLVDLLIEIEASGSLHKVYPPHQFFYDLTFNIKEKIREISITPSRWQKATSLDYSGIIIINKMSFLCRGDFQLDTLFKKTGDTINVKLKKPKIYQYDNFDLLIDIYIRSPSLKGRYEICGGLPINMYVYTGKKLKSFTY